MLRLTIDYSDEAKDEWREAVEAAMLRQDEGKGKVIVSVGVAEVIDPRPGKHESPPGDRKVYVIWRATGFPEQVTICLGWKNADAFMEVVRQMGGQILDLHEEEP
jgi:hypothetical protein